MPTERSRNWVFTFFPRADKGDCDEDVWHHYRNIDEVRWTGREDLVSYMGYGWETCPETGAKHLQGFVIFKLKKTMGGARKQIQAWMPTAHVEMMKGTVEQSVEYCSKEGQFRDWGVKPQQGQRTDLAELAAELDTKTVDEITEENPTAYHQYGRTLEKLETIKNRKRYRTEPTLAEWLWGPTGCGKTRRAFEGYDPETHYVWPDDGEWWDGYNGQETVIIDEFRGQIKYSLLLRLLDRYPVSVRQRNKAPFPFTSTKVIITSALPPHEVYTNLAAQDRIDQLLRRCDVVDMTPPPPTFNPTSI